MNRGAPSPRILLVSANFFPRLGGAERHGLGLATALRRRGVDVLVLTSAVEGTPSHEEVQGVPVVRSIHAFSRGAVWGVSYMLSTLWALLRLRHRYDLIHCQQLYLHTPIAILSQCFLGKPVVVRLACTGSFGDLATMTRIKFGSVMLGISRRAKAFVALSRDGIAEARKIGVPPERITTIPNGVRVADAGALPQPPEGAILFVGVLRKQKGLDCLLTALARVGNAPWRLCLVGPGPEEPALQRMAQQLGVSDRVRFVGQVEDPSPYYRRASLFVLPSWAEGMSNALLEAMAFGLPVVATRVGGSVDVIEDGVTGLLVEPGDPEQLAAAMARVLTDRGLARTLGGNAREAILRGHSMDAMVNQYLGVYHAVWRSGTA